MSSGKTPTAEFLRSAFQLSQLPRDRKPQIAFGGRSNVGKSTLINTLLERKNLAKTSSTPGRTQSLNLFHIDDRYYFVDLPGYGFARAPKNARESWGELVDSYLSECSDLKGMVLLLDCRREPNPDDQDLFEWLAEKKMPYIVVLTKTDKLNRSQLLKSISANEQAAGQTPLPFSAKTGAGKKELWTWILETIKSE